jgi:hypothetical protein
VLLKIAPPHLGTGKVYAGIVMDHLEWRRADYYFVRQYESLEEELAQPIQRKGKTAAWKTPEANAGDVCVFTVNRAVKTKKRLT